MKKKVLMGLVLLAIIGTSAVFAQAPTLDKLTFAASTAGYTAMQKDRNISGAVVIPDTYNNKPVIGVVTFGANPNITSVTIPNSVTEIGINAFYNCTGIKSITIPASVTKINNGAFRGCTNLTSVTFQGQASTTLNNAGDSLASASFDGDLGSKYQAGGPGTYTRTTTGRGSVWTKVGGQTVCPTCGGTGYI